MTLLEDELVDVRNHCERQVKGSKLVACVPAMVRVDIVKTKHKQMTVCIQFPDNYPREPLLVELKSKSLAEKLLEKLSKICEEECRKYLGKPQIIQLLKFLKGFIEENPLCVCSEEIASIKKHLIGEQDELKLKQKTSSIILRITQQHYLLALRIVVPDRYPEEQIHLENTECNFPAAFQRWFVSQACEIARQCVEKPLKQKPKDPPFQPKPSLWPVIDFLIKEVKRYPFEMCQLCKKRCFPEDPKSIITNEKDSKYVERVYCGHTFHNSCLDIHMKTPPFEGGKKCPGCSQRIFHEKWKATPHLAEKRWAHHEAKKRELEEVVDFLQ